MRFWSPTDYTRRSSLWLVMISPADFFFFFFNDTATTEIYTLSLHDALPISLPSRADRGLPLGRFAGQPGGRLQNPRRAPQGDRKSTRLNSSHLVISYAVFCLKKKKKKTADRLAADVDRRNSTLL